KRAVAPGDVALELRGVYCRAAGVNNVSLTLRHGEICGVAGLVGSGRTELARTLFGVTPADAGDILVNGRREEITSPARAIALGVEYVPEDRRRHGVVPEMAVAENVTMASLPSVARAGLIVPEAERRTAATYVQELGVRTASLDAS